MSKDDVVLFKLYGPINYFNESTQINSELSFRKVNGFGLYRVEAMGHLIG